MSLANTASRASLSRRPFSTQHFLKRISKQNYWVESDWQQVRDVPYGRFVAHAICIGTIKG